MIKFYFKGRRITDEVGTFSYRAPHTGWFLVQNHYGHVTVECLPWTPFLRAFWIGLQMWWKFRSNADRTT